MYALFAITLISIVGGIWLTGLPKSPDQAGYHFAALFAIAVVTLVVIVASDYVLDRVW